MKARYFLCFALLALLIAVPACGKKTLKTENVTGVVTLDGSPLKDCTVTFVPAEGSSGVQSYGKTNASGEYKLQTMQGAADAGTTPGEYKVSFKCFETIETGTTTDDDGVEVPETESRSLLPEKYEDSKTSGFSASVVKGSNTFNFDLTSN